MADSGTEKRATSPRHHIDTGFINRRKCLSIFGRSYAEDYERLKHKDDDHMSVLGNDHLLIHLALERCHTHNIPTLAECLKKPLKGQLFCSTENVLGCGNRVYHEPRVSNQIEFPFETDKTVTVEYHTEHLYASTQKMLMEIGSIMCIVGEIFSVNGDNLIAHPLIVGPPTYDHPFNRDLPFDYTFDGWTHYQLYPRDIEQFSRCESINVTAEEWVVTMKELPEEEVKRAFCSLLGDAPSKDWGGEQYDHYSGDVTVNGNRKSAAFIFKGPSAWGEMKPRDLGKNGDQIYRLQQSGADILVLQHCHKIGEAVRETLRAFSVKPGNPKHYCIFDGKDTYRLLKAYGLLNQQTQQGRSSRRAKGARS